VTGHEHILALRRSGRAPRFVWVQDFPGAIYGAMNVRLAPTDVPEQLDFRFLVGLTALVEGFDHARVERIATACAMFAKRVVANVNSPVSAAQAYGGPTFPVIKTTDTEGVATWQE
jgi:hypothetical protein